MFGHTPIQSNRDRAVRVLADGTVVSASTAQSEYARALNFIGDRFTAATNTVSGVKTYDIALKYADKIIPYEAGVAKGSTPGYLNFDGNHFDVSSLASSMYTVTSTGRVKVNAISTIRQLNVVNTTNHTAVTAADNAGTDKIDLTFSNNDIDVLSNGTLVNTTPRRLNFSTDFTATDNSGSDRVDVGLAGGFLPLPYNKKFGMAYGGQSDLNGSFGDGLFNLSYTATSGTVSGVNSNTHGHARRYVSGSDDDDTIEVATDFPMTQLAYNPHIYGKLSLAVLEDARVMMGFNSDDIPSGDNDFLNDLIGFMIGYQYDTAETEDTNWQILRNDGDATQDKVSAGVALSSTTPFTFELVGEATPTPRWGWNINGGAFTYYTTEIPTLNQNLRFTFRIEEIGGDEMTLDMYYLYLVQNM